MLLRQRWDLLKQAANVAFNSALPRFRGWSQYHKSRHCRTLRGRAHLGDRHCPLSEDNRSNFSSDKRPSHAPFEIFRYSSVTRSLPAVRIVGLKAIRRNKKPRYCITLPRFGSSNLLRLAPVAPSLPIAAPDMSHTPTPWQLLVGHNLLDRIGPSRIINVPTPRYSLSDKGNVRPESIEFPSKCQRDVDLFDSFLKRIKSIDQAFRIVVAVRTIGCGFDLRQFPVPAVDPATHAPIECCRTEAQQRDEQRQDQTRTARSGWPASKASNGERVSGHAGNTAWPPHPAGSR